jgi:pyrroloquinoline quinone (PQQ) biosynthesis protein C
MKNRLQELNNIITPFRMEHCHSMQHIAKQGISMNLARELAAQYYAVNAASPQILAAGISQIWNEKLRAALVANLYEECGSGDVEKSHIAYFKRFMTAVNIDHEKAGKVKTGTPAEKLISTFLSVCSRGPDYKALAILHSFEDVFAGVCTLISKGIQKSEVVDMHAAEFFPIHSVADILHAERMRSAMLDAADTGEKWRECLDLVKLGASLLYDLFDSIAKTELEETDYTLSPIESCGAPHST